MASLRDIRTRIGSVKNTRQITNAMKMVSAAKLRRATEAATSARPYQQTLMQTLRRIAAAAGDIEDPLLTVKPDVRRILLVVIGTDRGLCGGFNGTLLRRVDDWIKARKAEGKTVEIRTYGKKPRDFMKARGVPVALARTEVTPPKFAAEATQLATDMASAFLGATAGTSDEEGHFGEAFDEVWLGHNHFKSTMTQVPTFTKILPLALEHAEEQGPGPDYRYEPAGPEILGALLPLYLRTQLLQAFLETEAGEQAARMAAMDNATRNANDLIKALTLDYNRGRQAAITKELIEIVSGAEAL